MWFQLAGSTQVEMDFRGYGPPLYPEYSPYPRAHPDPRDPFSDERVYSLCDLSLSDDQDRIPDDMPHWTGSPKKSRRPEAKHHDLKKSADTRSRNQNPGIDVALRNLNHDVGAALKTFQAFVQSFEAEIAPLQDWAEEYTLDTVWRNKVRDKCRVRRDKEMFGGMAGRIADSRAAVKGAVKSAKRLRELWDDRYKIEDQIRTAKKALVYGDSIIDLAERAASERVACKQLVFELEEARGLLDRKKHPWIYGEHATEKEAASLRQPKSDMKSAKKKREGAAQGNSSSGDSERLRSEEDGNGIGRRERNRPAHSVDSRLDQVLGDATDSLDGETW